MTLVDSSPSSVVEVEDIPGQHEGDLHALQHRVLTTIAVRGMEMNGCAWEEDMRLPRCFVTFLSLVHKMPNNEMYSYFCSFAP